MTLLYVGPLMDLFLFYVFTKGKTLYVDYKDEFSNIYCLRNYIFAPITEEIFYTSMLLNTYLMLCPIESLSLKTLLWQPSLFFGLAHIHHAYGSFRTGDQNLITILMNTIIQFGYTTLFGAFTNFIFLRTGGNLWACMFAHSFCNIMGFPGRSRLSLHFTMIEEVKGDWRRKLIAAWNKSYIFLLFLLIVGLQK